MSVLPRLAISSLFTGLLLGLALSAAAQPAPFTVVTGRVVQPGPAGPVPVPCCDVEVILEPSGVRATGRTRGDGTFRVEVACTDPIVTVTVNALCCAGSKVVDGEECFDPVTGEPRTIDVGDVECTAAPVTNRTLLEGGVVCRTGPFLDPVADCAVLVEGATPTGGESRVTFTDADGNWELCRDCPAPPTPGGEVLTVTAQCCDEVQRVPVDGCPERQTVDTFVCDPCPVPPCDEPREVEFTGRVTCTDNPFLPPRPVADCEVLVEVLDASGRPISREFVTTDAQGRYTSCQPCPGDEDSATWMVQAIPQCCASNGVLETVVGCPPTHELQDILCQAMQCPGCDPTDFNADTLPDQVTVSGRVTCQQGAPGNLVPIEGCEVLITPQGPSCSVRPFTVLTDANGYYTACLPCPDCTFVTVEATCCGAASGADLICSENPVLDLFCGECLTDPCDPDRTVNGRVTCTDEATGRQVPVPDCNVLIECPAGGGPPVTAVTDQGGNYSACYPCTGCTELRVTAQCCDAVETTPTADCDAETVDLNCSNCRLVFGECAGLGELAVHARGRHLCDAGAGADPVPLAGCTIRLEPFDAAGNPLPPVLTTTGGDGGWAECVRCGATGLSQIVATSECCDASSTTPVAGCPEEAQLDDVTCDDCSPCPAGMTRVQGRVHCRGGGAVAGCAVKVSVSTCSGLEIYDVVTDSEGKYRLCVPCPCPGATVRVTAECCGGTRTVPVDECGPVTPIPTVFCPVPCQ